MGTEPARLPRVRIETVDGLRGLAALLVVFDHTVGSDWGLGPWSHQNHGITIFALLSAFLLSAPFLRARLERRPPPRALAFLRARAARIYPGYWVALAVAALTVGLHSMGPGDGWRVATLTQTFGTDTPFEGLPPAWSLSLFLSFYLALPLWAWWRRRGDGPAPNPTRLLRLEVAWLLVAVGLSLVVRMTEATGAIAEDPVFTLLGRADWFAIGMLLAVLLTARSLEIAPSWLLALGRRPGLTMLAALAMTVFGALLPLRLEELRDQFDTLAAALLLAAAVLHGPVLRGPQRLLASRPARAVGRWSFGIFLWGYVLQKGIAQLDPEIATGPHLLLTMAGSIALGAASWRYVERPAMKLARRERSARGAAVPQPAAA